MRTGAGRHGAAGKKRSHISIADASLAERDDTEALDEHEIGGLVAIANLDEEAAAAYETVAAVVSERRLRDMLRSFADDHRAHVAKLKAVLRAVGIEPPSRRERPDGLLVDLASTLGRIGGVAALNTLIANEQLTNGTYGSALIFVTLAEAQNVLVENAADERRHLEELLAHRAKDKDAITGA